MFILISSIVFNSIYYIKFLMRVRISRGTLVGSTDRFRAIKAKRMIVEVLYSFRRGIVIERTIDVRQTIEQ